MKKIILFYVLFVFSCNLWSQVSINASGNTANSSAGSISYSVGQPFYQTVYSNGFYLVQGVQQPFEISVLGTDNHPQISLDMQVYPNPTTSILFLKIENKSFKNLEYHLFDALGRDISQRKITQAETSIDFNQKQSGIYFLIVSEGSVKLKTFKILKK